MGVVIVLASWLLVGIICWLVLVASDIRGTEFNLKYFNSECWDLLGIAFLLGYIFVPITIIILWCEDCFKVKTRFCHFVYKLTNIGIKH